MYIYVYLVTSVSYCSNNKEKSYLTEAWVCVCIVTVGITGDDGILPYLFNHLKEPRKEKLKQISHLC